MNIALDYDGTFTADPTLFSNFIRMAQQLGHTVYIVTMRYDIEGERIKHDIPCNIIYTGRKAKIKFVSGLGITMHIWIDDMPHLLFSGAD